MKQPYRVKMSRTPIPYQDSAVQVGKGPDESEMFDRRRMPYFPRPTVDYEIMCRIKASSVDHSYPDARRRCDELHGTTFDGVFLSANYFTFYRIIGEKYVEYRETGKRKGTR